MSADNSPEVNKAWFELTKFRQHSYDTGTVWIPLRASEYVLKIGEQGENGYIDEFFGVGTLAVPVEDRDKADIQEVARLAPKVGR
jgi:hypothetical protein